MREISVDVARLPRFLAFYEKDSEDSVDCFLVVIGRHVPPVAGSVLETQSVHPQASLFPVGTLVPLPTLWHFNGAGILALRNQQTEQAIAALARTPDPTVPSRVKSPLWKVHKPRCAHSGFLLIGNYSISPMESSIVFIRVARYPGLSLARRTPTPKARRSREAS